jgi:hypothetical protein
MIWPITKRFKKVGVLADRIFRDANNTQMIVI